MNVYIIHMRLLFVVCEVLCRRPDNNANNQAHGNVSRRIARKGITLIQQLLANEVVMSYSPAHAGFLGASVAQSVSSLWPCNSLGVSH